MARGSEKKPKMRPDGPGQKTYPVGLQSDWVQIIDNLATADNSGNLVLNPGAVDGTHHHDFRANGRGTTLMARVKYDDVHVTIAASPKIQFFGRDHNGAYHKLKDATPAHDLTLTCAPTTDHIDGTYRYSDPVEIDLDGCEVVRAAIHVAFDGSGSAGEDALSYLEVKTK